MFNVQQRRANACTVMPVGRFCDGGPDIKPLGNICFPNGSLCIVLSAGLRPVQDVERKTQSRRKRRRFFSYDGRFLGPEFSECQLIAVEKVTGLEGE